MISKKIGKVTINLIEDKEPEFTTDEKKLLDIIENRSSVEFPGIIENNNSYFYLENLSKIRGNIVKWLPIMPSDNILVVGNDTGIINQELTKLSDNIVSVVQNLTYATILASRLENCRNAYIYATEVECAVADILNENRTFEWIFIYDGKYLNSVKKLLSPTGRIVLITDNRMGMKFLAGNKQHEDYFSGVEGKSNNGVTLSGLLKLIKEANLPSPQLYYPYPDWRFAKNLYSDSRLPLEGELVNNINNYDADRMLLFSEKDAFDASVRDGSFSLYSNSYMAIIGEPLSTNFVRFSDDRSSEHSIYTAIETKPSGEKVVRKYPAEPSACGHIQSLASYYNKLNERYQGSDLNINSCVIVNESTNPVASFEYLEGVQLSSLMDSCLSNDDLEGFYTLFDKFVKYIGYNEDFPFADLDLVFSNILVDGDTWNLIDYEWCKENAVSTKELAYRAVYCYILEDEKRKKINLDLIRNKLGLAKSASDLIEADEVAFQKKVTGKNKSLDELRESFGHKVINPIPLAEKINAKGSIFNFKVYPGDSFGNFSEESAYLIKEAYKSDSTIEALIPLNPNDIRLRIDPMDAPCLVTVKECRINELDYPIENKKRLLTNGKRFGDKIFVFDTSDPNFVFDLSGLINEEASFMYISLDIIELKNDTATALCMKQGLFK